ncbi:hypothetical protein GW17_00061563 [Ensete ventricosum]|nr:hypothetical protein GW17_00061563 [Ensete ventricosum]
MTPQPSLPLHRWQLPLPAGSRPAKGRPPLRLAPSPLLAVALAAGGSPLRAPYNRPPLQVSRSKQLCLRASLLSVGAAPTGGCRPLRASLASLSG